MNKHWNSLHWFGWSHGSLKGQERQTPRGPSCSHLPAQGWTRRPPKVSDGSRICLFDNDCVFIHHFGGLFLGKSDTHWEKRKPGLQSLPFSTRAKRVLNFNPFFSSQDDIYSPPTHQPALAVLRAGHPLSLLLIHFIFHASPPNVHLPSSALRVAIFRIDASCGLRAPLS